MFKAFLSHVPESPSARNHYGDYVPSVPEPFWVGFGARHPRCLDHKDLKFRSRAEYEAEYEGHYALVHILALRWMQTDGRAVMGHVNGFPLTPRAKFIAALCEAGHPELVVGVNDDEDHPYINWSGHEVDQVIWKAFKIVHQHTIPCFLCWSKADDDNIELCVSGRCPNE